MLHATVVRGDGLGAKIGFPTANLRVPSSRRLGRGVFRVLVSGGTLAERAAVCNVGLRPTVGGRRRQVEVHIPGFRGNLYGKRLAVRFIGKLRDEKKFPSLAALKTQIRRDIQTLKRRTP